MTKEEQEFLQYLANYFSCKQVDSFLVGGGVRDLFMGSPMQDFDIMLVADAAEMVKEIFANKDFFYSCSKPIIFKKYKTAKIKFSKNDFSIDIDFSSARKEIYSDIAASPICTPATLHEDLARRDFTINSMALALNNLRLPIDPFDGLNDVKLRQIRVLHDLSFKDDPIRMLRAIRFAVRFDYELESNTKKLFFQAINSSYANFLPERRAHEEIKKALNEEKWQIVINKTLESGLLKQLSPVFNKACLNSDLSSVKTNNLSEKINLISSSLSETEKQTLLKNFNL